MMKIFLCLFCFILVASWLYQDTYDSHQSEFQLLTQQPFVKSSIVESRDSGCARSQAYSYLYGITVTSGSGRKHSRSSRYNLSVRCNVAKSLIGPASDRMNFQITMLG